jgi:small-conductance mechanosensitive channel
MLINTWGEVFSTSLQALWLGFISFVPNLIIAIIVFIIGWVIASVVDKALRQVIGALKVDRLFQSAGVENAMNRAGIKLSVGGFIGSIVKWFIVVVFLMTSLEVIGLTQVNDFLREVVLQYLPQVIIAAFVLILASVISDAMKKIIVGSAKAAGIHSANMLGSIAYYAIWIFAFIIALSQLGVAPTFMQILFTGIIAMLAIAGGLAFGLGGKDAAARSIEKIRGEMMASRE